MSSYEVHEQGEQVQELYVLYSQLGSIVGFDHVCTYGTSQGRARHEGRYNGFFDGFFIRGAAYVWYGIIYLF